MTTGNMVININKTKTLFVIFGSLIFVTLGIWIIFTAQEPNGNQQKLFIVILLYAAGGLSVAFFGLCLVAGIWRLFSKSPGLELNIDGMIIFSAGKPLFINWQEIERFSIHETQNQKFLVVHIYNPDKYIFNGGKFYQSIAKANQNMCGSPISISSNTLDLKFEDLINACERYLVAHGIRH